MVAILEMPQVKTIVKDPVRPLPLENGDHLTRTRFERRDDAMEISGSSASFQRHAKSTASQPQGATA